jgi:FMN phosphatase YigB (HAD superfamily)
MTVTNDDMPETLLDGLHTQAGKLPKVSLLVTDLDNTLWDWVEIWYRSFSALLDGIVSTSGIPRDQLLPEIRRVHQRVGTSEYSYLIGDLEVLQKLHPGRDLQDVYAGAIDASRSARHGVLDLYPDVAKTLGAIRQKGTVIAAYTESFAFHTAARMKYLGLDGLVDYLYSPRDHDLPEGARKRLRRFDDDYYELKQTILKHTEKGILKPSPAVLRQIITELGHASTDTAYVGDSKMKDIVMAQDVGAIDVWAEYGAAQHRQEYELLRKVSHWTDEAVQKEMTVDVQPTVTLHRSFAELLHHFDFVKNDRR